MAFMVYGTVVKHDVRSATDATRVEVTMTDGRTLTYPGCTMDQFGGGVLTITDVDGADDLVVALGRGTWLAATAYDAHGYPDFTFTATKGIPA